MGSCIGRATAHPFQERPIPDSQFGPDPSQGPPAGSHAWRGPLPRPLLPRVAGQAAAPKVAPWRCPAGCGCKVCVCSPFVSYFCSHGAQNSTGHTRSLDCPVISSCRQGTPSAAADSAACARRTGVAQARTPACRGQGCGACPAHCCFHSPGPLLLRCAGPLACVFGAVPAARSLRPAGPRRTACGSRACSAAIPCSPLPRKSFQLAADTQPAPVIGRPADVLFWGGAPACASTPCVNIPLWTRGRTRHWRIQFARPVRPAAALMHTTPQHLHGLR
jgi:hypothetical protein